jgi:hypothetical protein
MATAAKKSSASGPSSKSAGSIAEAAPGMRSDPWILRAFDATYRFLASLKLAVLSLSALAAVLAYATFFEKWYGTAAVQEWIYRSPGFAILLTFLGTNILCAALIRYPWTKRQTGFVITHSGLLVVLAGSWISLKVTDSGQVGMAEGDESSQLIRIDDSAIRVQPIDPEKGVATTEFQLPFFPGTFPWEQSGRQDVLTTPEEPFRFVVKDFLPASSPVRYAPHSGPGGEPMIKAALFIKPPRSPREVELFERFDSDGRDALRWLKADDPKLRRGARDLGQVRLTFQLATRPEMVEDFLALPADPLKDDLIRFRYNDRAGKPRVFDWPNEAKEGDRIPLPDSDLAVSLVNKAELPLSEEIDPDGTMARATGEEHLHFVTFEVVQGGRSLGNYIACSDLPAVPNNPKASSPAVTISYYHPPELGTVAMQGRASAIDILGTKDGKLFYRALSREGLRGKGAFEPGKRIQLVGGANQPVAFSFRVDEYLTSGVDGERVEPIELPAGKKDQGVPAALAEMTVDGATKEFWIRRPGALTPTFQTVHFPKGVYRVSYDYDRKTLPFTLKLTDFEVGMDPGTAQASSFESQVLLTDPQKKVEEKPISISMNQPLTWRDYTFYQSNYDRVRDPRTGRPTGQFMSIFQVRYDPAWCWGTVYLGCLLVVLGTFVQFYMRAGVFTDGGKKERERAARREAARNGQARAATAPDAQAPVDAVDEPL